jgi:hypothetical protein
VAAGRVQRSMRSVVLALAAAALLNGQGLRIATIDFYGLHKVSEAEIRKALGFREGDTLPPSKGDVEDRIDKIPGVVESHLEAVCCESNLMVLYVGVEERGAPHFELREAPSGDVHLPAEIMDTFRQFLEKYHDAVRNGSAAEDLTQGHSLLADPYARAVQQMFPALVDAHLAEVRNVLRSGSDESERAAAAYVLPYASKQSQIVGDLQYALKDSDAGVRDNATRSLMALSVLARLRPESEIEISPTWFIEMLNSLSWSDRNRALLALEVLTDSRDPSTLDQLRDRAFDSLVEMANWKVLNHALPACILLGRIAGIPEQEIQDEWSRGERESIIAAAKKKKNK